MTDTAAPSSTRATVHILERMRAGLTALSPAERRVADAVLRDPLAVIHLSVSELAAAAETSPATVVRLCASLGLRGYQELKITLASESIPHDRRVLGEITPGDGAHEITHKVMEATARALSEASRSVDTSVLDEIARTVLTARRVQFGAVGTSAPLALDAAYRLVTLGIDASFASDVHMQHVTARMLRPGDVFFAISHTGSTFETLSAARAAKASGATTVSLTSFSRSPLTETTDLNLVVGSAETAYRVEAMASRIVHLAVLDALFVTLSVQSAASAHHLAMTEDVLIEHRL
ncbi:MurR/RpiR family transcriptional regulator [Herbiconiux ginsengi]|uniref:Transcriptional regulator, RpiR family n=1 Tax=Herbiconiux ginsengi TaxID=381665 RepID=A0A1H3KK81_9MICO|nr:MurR/RpiR family transcriptional regulator [Herbiconiux ginsengi]SDY52410.1 transcriptional regulator, RpiR family [Herbiconiux ginsengi]